MLNFGHIAEGWFRLVFKDEKIEDRAKIRAAECFKCKSMKKELKIIVCGECGCPIASKTRSNDKCPLDKWPV